jgi:molecular chaperone DnaK (HSP70)
MDYVMQRYEEENGEDISEDPEVVASLYVDVETWKKALTAREKINISVNGPAGRFREELTREKYDELTSDLLGRTKNLLDDVLKTARKQGYTIEKIDKVLLVGGSSKMPQVAAMIEKDYKIVPILSDPAEAVAKGAAIYAQNEKEYGDFLQKEALQSGKTVEQIKEDNLVNGNFDAKFAMTTGSTNKITITNVLSRTYGVEYLDNPENGEMRISNILIINDKLPVKKTKYFATLMDNQQSIQIKIYESRSTDEVIDVDERTPITTFDLKFTQCVPANTPVEMTLALDNSGILHVMAEEKLYHSKLDTTFKLSNQMTEAEMKNAVSRVETANID